MGSSTDMLAKASAASRRAADFVERFREVWENPTVERLDELVRSDVEFIQPLHATVVGRENAARFWRQVFALIPDLRLEVLDWAHHEDVVYIAFRMIGTLAGKPVAWPSIDRIQLDEQGKVRQRVAFFDPLPIVRMTVLRPRVLAALLRAGIRLGVGSVGARRRHQDSGGGGR